MGELSGGASASDPDPERRSPEPDGSADARDRQDDIVMQAGNAQALYAGSAELLRNQERSSWTIRLAALLAAPKAAVHSDWFAAPKRALGRLTRGCCRAVTDLPRPPSKQVGSLGLSAGRGCARTILPRCLVGCAQGSGLSRRGTKVARSGTCNPSESNSKLPQRLSYVSPDASDILRPPQAGLAEQRGLQSAPGPSH
jgi:hypothetical protein